ncbi:MAG: CBS domain-containing protein [Actinobacteria bacterium]|nr:CBS domain-containing protein [Actinomycetota bacterium]
MDVSRILEIIGGGGHSQAASAVLKDIEFPEIESRIISSLYRNIKKPVLAKDIMSFPIRVVNEDESIAAVNDLLKKYGHSGIPIVDKRKDLVGIITRKDVDRAIKHGLSHAPVKGFKSRGLVTASSNTTVDEIQRLMIENGIGRIPVVNRGEVVGIVTRKDVLRFLHGRDYIKRTEKAAAGGRYNFSPDEIIKKLHNLIPEKIFNVFEIISGTAKEMKLKVYLVGGFVRDLMLDISNLDIDIVVEGNGIDFARKLREVLNARLESYEKFGTAVVVLPSGQHIDVASARVEYYQKPASLPDVEPGSISQDLARRDFTINTLAISLNRKDFGRIIDFFGGRKDLAGKKIKVLHKMSFIEDPTRIFRAVRFEQRLGFKMDIQTEKLARVSVEMNLVSELNGIRVRDELVAIIQEKNPWNGIKRLYDLQALKKIGIDVTADEKLTRFLKNISRKYKILAEYAGDNLEIWRVFLIAMFINCREDIIKKWCEEMKIRKNDAAVIINSALMFNTLKEKLNVKIKKYSDLFRLLNDKNDELLITLGAAGKVYLENILRYYRKVSTIKLEITGDDLKSLDFKPSRKFKTVLENVLLMKLDGLVKTKQEELQEAGRMLSGVESG